MWHALKRMLHKLYPDIDKLGDSQEDLDYLCKCMKEAWRKIPNSLILRLITTMPHRMDALRHAKGWQTKY
jgi:hypothetical protein